MYSLLVMLSKGGPYNIPWVYCSSYNKPLSDHLWDYLQKYVAKHRSLGNGFGFGLVNLKGCSRILSARYFKDSSEILISQPNGKNPSRLTPQQECARLMGFPESFKIG